MKGKQRRTLRVGGRSSGGTDGCLAGTSKISSGRRCAGTAVLWWSAFCACNAVVSWDVVARHPLGGTFLCTAFSERVASGWWVLGRGGRGGVGTLAAFVTVTLLTFDAATYSRRRACHSKNFNDGAIGTDGGCMAGSVGISGFAGLDMTNDPSIACARGSNGPAIRMCASSGVMSLLSVHIGSGALCVNFGGGIDMSCGGLRMHISTRGLGNVTITNSKSIRLGGKLGASSVGVSITNSNSVDKGGVSYASLSVSVTNSKSVGDDGVAYGSLRMSITNSNSVGLGGMATGFAETSITNSNATVLDNDARRTRCDITNSNSLLTSSFITGGTSTDITNSNSVGYRTASFLGMHADKDNDMNCGNGPRLSCPGGKLCGLWREGREFSS